MPLGGSSFTTTAATMTTTTFVDSMPAGSHTSRNQSPSSCSSVCSISSSRSIGQDFNEAQCLFCDLTNTDLDANVAHMSRAHGLHIETANLVVDVATILAYFHLIISECYECLYCGCQRSTRQGIQQHMISKGHCKYDLDADADLRDFYDFASSDEDSPAARLADSVRFHSKSASRKSRPSRHRSPLRGADEEESPPDPPASTSPATLSNALSTRALKQEHTLNAQLAQLRTEDRRSLAHLPTSQQRALLATHHKQGEKAKRAEQIKRTHLESAGNHFGRLSTIRLVRKPPHYGNVGSLNR